jgi:hypothetical protein
MISAEYKSILKHPARGFRDPVPFQDADYKYKRDRKSIKMIKKRQFGGGFSPGGQNFPPAGSFIS